MRFETKIAVIVRDDLETWQRLNVTAFLASGIAANPDLLGEPYADADGTRYLPLFGQPVLVLEGTKEVVAAARERAVRRGVPTAVFTADMFATGHDAANRAVVAAAPTSTWSAWRYTALATPSTRSPRGRRCTGEARWGRREPRCAGVDRTPALTP